MKPLRLSMNKLALYLRVPVTWIADIVGELRVITADTALRLARYFKNAPVFWMNLQTRYDLEVAQDELAGKVERDVQPLETASGRCNSPAVHCHSARNARECTPLQRRSRQGGVLTGDTERARAKYQDFLTLWKDADPDIPVLKQAKAEYAKLQ